MDDSHCTSCDGDRYLVGTLDAQAVARRCQCFDVCPACQNQGHILVTDEEGNAYARACDCRFLDQRIARFNEARIPARFARTSLDDYKERDPTQKKAKYAFLQYRDDYTAGQRGLLVWGKPGVGKTHLVCSLMSYLTLERGISCRYVEFMQLIFDLKKDFAEGRWESSTLSPLLSVEVLLIDELGKGRNSEWEIAVLDELVSSRYNSGKTLLATSNYLPRATPGVAAPVTMEGGMRIPGTLDERLGDRIFSRLTEMCQFMEVTGDDYRAREADSSSRKKGLLSTMKRA
jgi:DNA replication protein DnaC